MASVTHRVGTATTTGAGPYASGAFTPAASELLVALCVISNSGTPSLTSSVGGQSFATAVSAVYATSAHSIAIFVSTALATAVSQTVTLTGTGTPTGSIIWVAGVSGMSKTGATAVLQTGKTDNGAGGATVAPAFPGNAQTGNPTLGMIGDTSNPGTMTPPTGWTEPTIELGYNTPATGSEYCFRDSGFTGTTITWGSTSPSTYAAAIIELDSASAVTLPPPIQILSQAVNRAASW